MHMNVRPIVLFDASNKLHRTWVNEFFATSSWKHCPVRFAVKEDHGFLMGHIQREMLEWYAEQDRKGRISANSKPGRKRLVGLTGGGFELTM